MKCCCVFVFNSVIRISLKSWHMLVNLCFHIFLTCAMYIGGITQSRNATICQAVSGMLFWEKGSNKCNKGVCVYVICLCMNPCLCPGQEHYWGSYLASPSRKVHHQKHCSSSA